jgi:hypothetical protein
MYFMSSPYEGEARRGVAGMVELMLNYQTIPHPSFSRKGQIGGYLFNIAKLIFWL